MKNVIKKATLLASGRWITPNELYEIKEDISSNNDSNKLALHNEELEKSQIINALKETQNNKSRAAQLLGIDRKTLYNKLKLYHIEL